jgi:hypothetical protein
MTDETTQRSAREEYTRRHFLAQSALLAATPLSATELMAQVPVRQQESDGNAAPPPPTTRSKRPEQ